MSCVLSTNGLPPRLLHGTFPELQPSERSVTFSGGVRAPPNLYELRDTRDL